MVQILPQLEERPSFGSQIARGLGAGFSHGLGQASQFAQQMAMEKYKTGQRQKLLSGFQTEKQLSYEDLSKEFVENLPEVENKLGRELDPEEVNLLWNKFSSAMVPQQKQSQPSETEEYLERAEQAAVIGEKPLSDIFAKRAGIVQKEKSQDKKLAFSETKDYRDTISTQSRSASELEPVLNQLENLIKSDKLTNPIISKLAEKTGLIGLLNPSSQQFHALSIGFLKDAKNIFGSRVTNYDLQTYIDKIPRLTQTNAGKKAIIDNFRTLGEGAKIKNKVKNQIIKENKGIPPIDLEERVEERSASEMDKLAEKFNKSFIESSKGPSGKIRMRNSKGELGEVDEDNVQMALDKGYSLE